MSLSPLQSALTLSRGPTGRVGADRIALIEAIAKQGSITSAAKLLNISYRAAWDAVQALNNLFNEPLVLASPGGAKGGVAEVTARGLKLISAYRAMEARLTEAWARVEADGADLWSLGLKTSARNALRGAVESVSDGAVNCAVRLRISDGLTLTAIVTRTSVEDLGLAPGAAAIALIKASFVELADGATYPAEPDCNALPGQVMARTDGTGSSEIAVALAGGKTLISTLAVESAKALNLKIGDPVVARIEASNVILAVE